MTKLPLQTVKLPHSYSSYSLYSARQTLWACIIRKIQTQKQTNFPGTRKSYDGSRSKKRLTWIRREVWCWVWPRPSRPRRWQTPRRTRARRRWPVGRLWWTAPLPPENPAASPPVWCTGSAGPTDPLWTRRYRTCVIIINNIIHHHCEVSET